MKPYGPQEDQQNIGLFTFYRQQAQLQNELKYKHKAQSLNKILYKVSKTNTQHQNNKQFQQIIKQRPPQTQRASDKLRQITQENLQHQQQSKRQQYKVNKSVLEIGQKVKQKGLKRQKTRISQKQQSSNHINLNNRDKSAQNNVDTQLTYKVFSKYLSELDMIRARKKKKQKVITDKSSYDRSSLQFKYNNSQLYEHSNNSKNKNRYDDIQAIEGRNKISVQFKKLALEPQQFGLGELSKSFVPIAVNKKQKTGLKSYRKEKEKALTQIRRVEHNNESLQKSNNLIPNEKVGMLSNLLSNYQNSKSTKMITVQKLQGKPHQQVTPNTKDNGNITKNNSNLIGNLINNTNNNNSNLRSQSLPRLKINLPQILSKNSSNHLNNKSNNKHSQPNPNSNNNNNILAMSLQLQRSYQLRSRYQIRAVQKQDDNILTLNKRIRNQIKRVRNQSQHQVKHYLSLKNSQKHINTNSNNNNNNNSNNYQSTRQKLVQTNNKSVIENKQLSLSKRDKHNNSIPQQQQYQISPSTSMEKLNCKELSFNKHKQIFCKRDQYLKNYKDKLKTNIFKTEKHQQSNIFYIEKNQSKTNQIIQNKKNKIIDSFIGKLTLL